MHGMYCIESLGRYIWSTETWEVRYLPDTYGAPGLHILTYQIYSNIPRNRNGSNTNGQTGEQWRHPRSRNVGTNASTRVPHVDDSPLVLK
jgi:hypothetical protein